MKVDFTSSLASAMLAVLFLSNDLVASVHALNNRNQVETQAVSTAALPTFSQVPTEEEKRTESEPREAGAVKVAPAANQTVFSKSGHAYLGQHRKDRMNSPEDDVFHLELRINKEESRYAYLEYETWGIANPEDLSKSINGHRVFGSGELQTADGWKKTRVSIPVEELEDGLNSVRFCVSPEFRLPVEVKDVRLTLSAENVYGLEVQPPVFRYRAEREDFEVLADEPTEQKGYKLSHTEVASIPVNITNVTRNAQAYHLEGSAEKPYHLAIGVDAAKVRSQEEMKLVEVFYFDDLAKKWLKAQTLKVDHARLRVEAMVPGGETDYFAGLIKAPEMPEASAYVPTNISDIEPANPATGIRLMQPPQVNRMGSASINYPMWIPEGRNGMTPRFALTYNSDNGTGWMGVGWNIAVSNISVDTKWGVPTFSGDFETEGYLVDGEAVFQQGGFRPNKAKLDGSGNVITNPRQETATQYFPRVQNGYQTIMRYGTDTKSYCWKVTDASGTETYYGTADGSTIDTNSVLRFDPSNPIVKWFVTKVVDKWGNTIEYDYENYSFMTGGQMKSAGKGKYLKKIRYTGYNSTPGLYEIEFVVSMNRPDATVMMNYGYKVIDDVQLDSVRVKYDSDILVKYAFDYTSDDDTHFKNVLTSISEIRDGEVFYQHDMEYYDGTIEWESTPHTLNISQGTSHFGNAPWHVQSILNPLFNEATPSPLQTSVTDGSSGHGSLGIGVDAKLFGITLDKTKGVCIGINGSKGFSDVVRKMEDMNGDGIPDMLMDIGNQVYYRPITREGSSSFAIGQPIKVGVSSIEQTKSTSFGFKLEVIGDKNSGPAQVGINYSRGKSMTGNSLTDYNADGFPDVLYRNGNDVRVRFGQVDYKGEYSFVGSSENTFNPVIKGVTVSPAEDDPESYRPMEIVRVWEAFAEGEIHITGTAEIKEGLGGVAEIAIQHNNSFVTTFATVDTVGSQTIDETVSVVPGDKIMFRSRSAVSGSEDFLNWDPEIAYVEADYEDGQRIKWSEGTAQQAFTLSAHNAVTFVGSRGFRVALNYSNSSSFSDNLDMIIEVYVNGELDTLYSTTMTNGGTGSPGNTFAPFIIGNPSLGSNYYDLPGVDSEDLVTLKFRLAGTSNIHWSALQWVPVVYLEQDCADPIEDLYPVPEYEVYNKAVQFGGLTNLGSLSNGVNYQLLPMINVNTSQISSILGSNTDVVYMTVKSNGVFAERIAVVFVGNGGSSTILLRNVDLANLSPTTGVEFVGSTSLSLSSLVLAAQTYFIKAQVPQYCKVEFQAKGPKAEQLIAYIQSNITGLKFRGSNGLNTNLSAGNASYFAKKRNDLQMHYKHWGVFSWSPLFGNEDAEIDTAKLVVPGEDLMETEVEEADTAVLKGSEYNASNFEFWALQAIRGEKYRDLWGFQRDNLTERERDRYGLPGIQLGLFRAQRGSQSPCILGELEAEAFVAFEDVVGTYSPNYIAYGCLSEGKSYTLSINGSFSSFSGAMNISDPLVFFSRQFNSLVDINGDGYPDVLTDNSGIKAQLTNPLGGYVSQTSLANIPRLGKGTSMGYDLSWAGTYGNEDARFKLSGNISFSQTWSKSRTATMDFNGDGLPDSYVDDIGGEYIYLNTGSNFSGIGPGPEGTIRNQSYGLAAGALGTLGNFNPKFSKWVKSISAGMSINVVGNYSEKFYHDFNGDGLVDYVNLTGADSLWLNTGNGFVLYDLTSSQITPINENINKSGNTGAAAQATLTLGPIFSGVKFPITGGYSDNYAINRLKTSFMDMNGDGAPDYVHSDDGNLKIYYAKFGKANKLKKVTNPLGGSFTINYEVAGNKRGYHDPVVPTHLTDLGNEKILWDMPMGKVVMSSVVVDDGQENNNGQDVDGDDLYTTRFAYDGGIKLRRERDFAGFTRVATIQEDFYGVLIDSCLTSDDFEVEAPRPSAGLYDTTLYATTMPSTAIKSRIRYNMTVQEYERPVELSFGALNTYFYKKDVQLHNYLLHVHEWQDTLAVGYKDSIARDVRLEWDHQHVELISDDGIDGYELRMVSTGVEETETALGQVENEGGEDWLLAEELYAEDDFPENLTLFPAVTDKRTINYPVVEDRDGVHIQKYRIKYDEYFNVIWFEDYGVMTEPHVTWVPVDTFYSGHYHTITQQNACTLDTNFITVQDVGQAQYVMTVACMADTGYSDDIIYGLYPNYSSCGNFDGVGPLAECAADSLYFLSYHNKWIEDTSIVYNALDASLYDQRIIAVMEYFDPSTANDRTNQLKVHKIYSQNTSTESNLRRYTKVEALEAGKNAPAEIANYLEWNPSDVKAITDLKYDVYGNVTRITGPENHQAQRNVTHFDYDATLHQFVEKVTNTYDDFACNIYDRGFQQLLQTTDANGQKMRYAYDQNRRLKHIWAPRELQDTSNGPTITFRYFPHNSVPVALTYHNTGSLDTAVHYGTSSSSCDALISTTSLDTIMSSSVATATFTDGLDRVIQIQTQTDWDDPSTAGVHTMTTKTRISGITAYDRFANKITGRNDFLADAGDFGDYQLDTSRQVMRSEYDYLNRPVKMMTAWPGPGTTGTDWNETTVSRSWVTYSGDLTYREESETEGETRTRKFLDSKGRQIAVAGRISSGSSNEELTTFVYDELSQLKQVVDPAEEVTSYYYDYFGRMTDEVHPDRGTSTMVYDLAGNMTELHTPGTEQTVANGYIEMKYDFNRMVRKLMPKNSPSDTSIYDVAYAYGSRGDGSNGAGRVVEVVQGDSAFPVLTEHLKYDELGQRSQQLREIDVPQSGLQTYKTKFRYDSFGRAVEMKYPNNERVRYLYSSLGALIQADVAYSNCGNLPNLIDTISYDGFGNIVYLQYGNGTENEYGYHTITRSLMRSSVMAIAGAGYLHDSVMSRRYGYNSLGLVSGSIITPHRSLITSRSNVVTTYTYDGLQRLTDATSTLTAAPLYTGDVDTHNPPPVSYNPYAGDLYSVETTYLPSGRLAGKQGDSNPSAPVGNSDLSYELSMGYNTSRVHQLDSVSEVAGANSGSARFTYNGSGSITGIDRDVNGNTEGSIRILWNEEQWMVADSTANGIDHYVYDYTGERLMKASYTLSAAWQNDNALGPHGSLGEYKVYVNPYCVALNYDYEGQQTAWITQHYYMGTQRVASGRFARISMEESRPAPGGGGSAVLDELEGFLKTFGLESGKDYTRSELEKPLPLKSVHPEYTEETGLPSANMTTEGGLAEYCEGIITEVYWYHPNYLGNVDLVTNLDGEVHQFFLYSAWGESLHEHNAQTTGFDSPFRFNAKELDEQTGLHYYGARYYQNKYNIWLSVDRFASKYPSLTPYQYSGNNPIHYIDINGDSLWIIHNTGFLGLFGKQTLLYQNGGLYNRDGSQYTGKVSGFLAKTVNALNTISSTKEGSNLIGELQSSKNNFNIVQGYSHFDPNDPIRANANRLQTDPDQANTHKKLSDMGFNLAGGSGGTIYWNSSGNASPTQDGMRINATMDLAHEMFHGLDANRGLIDSRLEQGIERNEWQAVYRENVLRTQLGLPLRTHYMQQQDFNGSRGVGPFMLSPNNKPLLPSWYKP